MSPHLLSLKISYTFWVLTKALVATDTVRMSCCDHESVRVCVCVFCRRWLCVDQLPKLGGLIHLSHASLGNAGSLIKD